MQKRSIPVLFTILIAVAAAVIIGCNSSDSYIAPAPTLDKESRRATEEARPTVDVFGNRAAEPIREVGRSLERLSRLALRFDERIAEDISGSGGTSELTAEGWFDDCCDEVEEDLLGELLDIEEVLAKLTAIYEEAADEPKLQIIRQVETAMANISALVTVLSESPTSNGAASIVQDISLELDAFSEAFAGLG